MTKEYVKNKVAVIHWTHAPSYVVRILEFGKLGYKDIILETVDDHKTFEWIINLFESWGCNATEKKFRDFTSRSGEKRQATQVTLKRIGALQK